jgi:phospholipid/cholesterol/gamma-HCH transport system ATP-binding protein
MSAIIELQGIGKSLGGHAVLRDLDLSVERGETLVIVGRSGCGKTVLLKHVMGLMKPDEGRVIIDGVDITRLSERALDGIRLKLGMLFQEAALFDSLTVFENVGFALQEHTKLSRERVETRVKECLTSVGLEGIEALYPEALSGGMKKRVGLARAIALRPEILLYDEPTSGVDPLMGAEINLLIQSLRDQLGVTSLVVTHDVESALQIGDRIALLDQGRIAVLGTPEQLQVMDAPVVREFFSGHGCKSS